VEGVATVFVAIDHFVGDLVGIHAARPGTRFEALEPIHQGLREHYVPLAKDVVAGLVLQHDHGPQYMSHAFQQEIAFLGVESSPSFVRPPQGNGVVERFIRSLKEQLLWVRTFDTVEELRLALLDFRARFNQHWLLQRHGYMTPAEVRSTKRPRRRREFLGKIVSRVLGGFTVTASHLGHISLFCLQRISNVTTR